MTRYAKVIPNGAGGFAVEEFRVFNGAAPSLPAGKPIRWVPAPLPEFDARTQRAVMQEPAGLDIEAIGYIVESRPLIDCKTEAKTAVTAKRYTVETGGVTVGEAVIRTDRESQGLIGGAYSAAKNGVIDNFDFKSATGWVTLPAANVIAVGELVATHVQGCFSRERALHEAIDAAGDHSALLAMDIDADWPSNV